MSDRLAKQFESLLAQAYGQGEPGVMIMSEEQRYELRRLFYAGALAFRNEVVAIREEFGADRKKREPHHHALDKELTDFLVEIECDLMGEAEGNA